jgi:hypothetical protein
MLKGAVFGGVEAVVDRTFATEYFRRTGIWPGKTGKPQDSREPHRLFILEPDEMRDDCAVTGKTWLTRHRVPHQR